MNTITKKAIGLAVIVELASCIGMIFQTNPYGFWDKLCESVGLSPDGVSDALGNFFMVLHFPFVFLCVIFFHDPGCEDFNGRLVLTSPFGPLIMALQFTLWIFIFMGLMRLWERVKLRIRRHDD
jgi:hypothetical protein